MSPAKLNPFGDGRRIISRSGILRAVRFESQLGFKIEAELLQAMKDLKDSVPASGSERVRNEFIQILLSELPSQGIRRLLELGLLERLIPELMPAIGFDTGSSYHDKDVFEHSLAVLDTSEPDLTFKAGQYCRIIQVP